MAHTPGPWTPTVAYGHGGYPEFWVDNEVPATRDDMRLIAAAPDLLEAAKAALASSSLSESEPGGINILAVEAMLCAAIAKAEGR